MSKLKYKILIVDDDPQIRKILERMLMDSGDELLMAEDAFSALEQLKTKLPDLVILDIMMPGMSGIELCQKIREDFSAQPIKILMLSAKDAQSDRRKALEYGADDYVTKPFHIASLGRKIKNMLEKK